jgi:RNA-directed DNA polymerase
MPTSWRRTPVVTELPVSRPPISRKGVVAIDTTPSQEADRKASLDRWIKRTQEVLAFRSQQGRSFHRLFNLLRTKRLVEVALDNVLANAGAKTAGVDGMTKGDLNTRQKRERLIEEVRQELSSKSYRPAPVRRVYIPKPNGDRRPLGIPTLKDRVVQEMLRLILEPIYEAKFYAHSYGFRPFRSAHHAALRIKDLAGRRGYNYAIEGDIRKCFDRIHHAKLLNILRKTIKDERLIRLIKEMLKAGVMEDGAWHITDEGTPQGGIVSPLLANIYLNELDQFIYHKWGALDSKTRKRLTRRGEARPCFLVRYADDFVVMVIGTPEQAEQLKTDIAEFLEQELHLELSAEKTLVTPIEQGLDFLGFTIRKYREVTLITPSKKAVQRFKEKVKEQIWFAFRRDDTAGIVTLNRLISGWGTYYSRVSSNDVFRKLDSYIWWRVMRTAYRLRARRHEPFGHFCFRHRILYRFDLKKKNRWRQGGHYGTWADEAHTVAYIVTRLGFIPIRYVLLHPQLNPYIPDERHLLETMRGLSDFMVQYHETALMVKADYGPEWNVIRENVLEDSNHCCERCGRPIQGRTAHVHHILPLKQANSRRQANLKENLISLCPTCHARAEREGKEKRV